MSLKQLIEQIVEVKHQLDQYYEESPNRVVLRPSARQQDLLFLSKHLQSRRLLFPGSYRELLMVCDGAKFLFDDPNLNLLSAQEVAQGRHTVDEQDFPSLSRFVIASGNTSEFISFDPDTIGSDGEMGVVNVSTHGDQVRYDNLVDFFEEYLEYLQDALRLNQADREKLPDD